MAGRFTAVPVLLLTAWALLGCYSYVPVMSSPKADELSGSVLVILTPAGSESLRQALGTNVREIEGTVARSTADTLVLAVRQTTTSARERFVSSGDTVAVARQLVASISVQQYSRKRSLSLGAVVASLILLTLIAITTGSSGSGGTGQPGQPQP